jgi:hypothetical protein
MTLWHSSHGPERHCRANGNAAAANSKWVPQTLTSLGPWIVQPDKLEQQIGYILVLSTWRYWLMVCVRNGRHFSEEKHCARPVTRLLSVSKMSALTEAISVLSTQ